MALHLFLDRSQAGVLLRELGGMLHGLLDLFAAQSSCTCVWEEGRGASRPEWGAIRQQLRGTIVVAYILPASATLPANAVLLFLLDLMQQFDRVTWLGPIRMFGFPDLASPAQQSHRSRHDTDPAATGWSPGHN